MIEYVILFIFFLIMIPILYIKIRYPFWSNQPVFHTYDYLRFWTRNPYIIQKGGSLKTKYLTQNVTTESFLDISSDKKDKLEKFIQEHYVDSDKVLAMITKQDLVDDLSVNPHPSYVSFYNDKRIDYNPSTGKIDATENLMGCMTSRAVKIYLNTDEKFQETVYYWDYICTHRDSPDKYLGRNIIQTHEKNQRHLNPQIPVSLFKFESDLCSGVVPLVEFNVHTYPIVKIVRPPMSKFSTVRIKGENVNLLFDYLYNITHNIEYKPFLLCIFPDTTVLDHLIETGRIIVYALLQQSKICGIYIFRDPKLCYEFQEERDVLECVSSITTIDLSVPDNNSIYFGGFLHALYDIQQTHNDKFKLITFFELANNSYIIERWKWKYSPISVQKSAYYLYNAVLPGMPIQHKNALIFI